MTERITLVVGGFDALATALTPVECFEQVIPVGSTGQLRELIVTNQIPKNDPGKVAFVFGDTMTVDTPQTLEFLVGQLTALGWKVLIVELSPGAIEIVRAHPKAGFLQGPFRVNDVLYALSNLGTSAGIIPPFERGNEIIEFNPGGWVAPSTAPATFAPPAPKSPAPLAPAPPSEPAPAPFAPAPPSEPAPAPFASAPSGWASPSGAPLIPSAPAPRTDSADPPRPDRPASEPPVAWQPPPLPTSEPAPWTIPASESVASTPWTTPAAESLHEPPFQPSRPSPDQYFPTPARPPIARADAPGPPAFTQPGEYGDYPPRLGAQQRRARVITVTSPKGGTGKALALTEVVPTPTGWSLFKDLKVGDALFDERGAICHVTALSPTWDARPCYELQFSDSTTIIADAEHEWPIFSSHEEVPSILTTQELFNIVARHPEDPASYQLPIVLDTPPLELPETSLPLDPYVLGMWLAGKISETGHASTDSPHVLEALATTGFVITDAVPNESTALKLFTQLRTLEALDKASIPSRYLRSSRAQRLALLQGLLSLAPQALDPSALYAIELTSLQLHDDVCDLIRSLGGATTTSWSHAAPTPVATLTFAFNSSSLAPARRYVVTVTPVPSQMTRCIEVDSPSHLFLAGRAMVPTHNSTLTLNLAVYLGLRLRKYGKRVCVIDANFQQADAGKLLDKYSPNIVNLSKDRAAITPEQIERYLITRDELNISALLGPAIPSEANPVLFTGALYNSILEALRPNFDYIFIDTPVAEIFHDIFKNFALPQADFILVPITPAYHTVMNADAWLSTITQPTYAGGEGVDPAIIGIVLNQSRENVGITEEEIRQELFHWKFLGSIPDTNEWVRALNNNELIATKNIHELNVAFGKILYEATGEQEMLYGIDLAGPSERRGLLGRFLRRG